MQFMSIICSLGCGIGYGYLHRIPSELLEQKQKARMGVNPIPAPPMPASAPPITPTKDGFSDVSIKCDIIMKQCKHSFEGMWLSY